MDSQVRIRVVSARRTEEILPLLGDCPAIYLVYDRAVAPLAGRLEELLAGDGRLKGTLSLETGEAQKRMDRVLDICRFLLERGADRGALVLAAGGGITTDLAGFAASIYKRGIRFAFIPTTLLAQVDAAIGGKNGVNLDGYKNILGVIRQPEFTFLCPEALAGLPDREIRGGAAELLKTFLIDNRTLPDGRDGYGAAVQLLSQAFRPEQLGPLVEAAASVKAEIVSQDPVEKGIRKVLNLGHTFAHALEWRSSRPGAQPLSHGEAVALGILFAARLSEALGKAREGLAARLEADFRAAGLPTCCPWPLEEWAQAMDKDKKAVGAKVCFILPVSIGQVEMHEMTVEEAVARLS